MFINDVLDYPLSLTRHSTYEGKCPTFDDVTKGQSGEGAPLNSMIEVVESIHAVWYHTLSLSGQEYNRENWIDY